MRLPFKVQRVGWRNKFHVHKFRTELCVHWGRYEIYFDRNCCMIFNVYAYFRKRLRVM